MVRRERRGAWAVGLAGALLGAGMLAPQSAVSQSPEPFERDVKPLIEKYCFRCHGAQLAIADLNLSAAKSADDVRANPSVWKRAIDFVKTGHMPPPGSPQPSQAERDRLAAGLEAIFNISRTTADPGRVALRRLNRLEHRNTIRDLLQIDYQTPDDFPVDNVAEGFDNIGEALTISPLLMEKYLDAAEKAAEQALPFPAYRELNIGPSDFEAAQGVNHDNGLFFFTNARAGMRAATPQAGKYELRITVSATQAGPAPARFGVDIDGRRALTYDVEGHNQGHKVVVPFEAQAGTVGLVMAFLNDFFDPNAPAERRDRNLRVESIVLAGPLGAEDPASLKALIPTQPEKGQEAAAARATLSAFLPRAWRRPVTDQELAQVMRFVTEAVSEGESYTQGMRYAVTAALASPHFIFRPEKTQGSGSVRDLDSHALASRLSYFIWSSTPDDRLLDLAKKGSLKDPKVLAAEADRMLKDPRAADLATAFGKNWLQLGRLADREPDPEVYSAFSDEIKADMLTETLTFFRHVVSADASVMDFVTGQYSFLNKRLARFYGAPLPKGDGFEMVNLSATPRTGVITQGSVLVATSNPTRTSPVKRGKWILEQVLGSPPPPPPPGADSFPEDVKNDPSLTFRQKLERHRESPACAGCHQRMDPLGFGLENFDGVGRWRTEENGKPVDVKGEMPGGIQFEGPMELRQYLSTQKKEFASTFSHKLLTFALGRVLRPQDDPYVAQIADQSLKEGMRFSSYVRAIVQSDAFRKATAP